MPDENRTSLMRLIEAYSFVLYETILFLDTHPSDTRALAFFQKYKLLKEEATLKYTKQYGPIVHTDVTSDTRFNWVDEPWPWEREV